MTVALNQNALTLLSTAKTYLDISATNTDYDDLVKQMINQASALISRHTQRILVTTEHTEFYSGRRMNSLILNQFPIVGGPATGNKPELFLDQSSVFTNPIDVDSYSFNSNEIIYPAFFSRGTRNIKVIYSAGLGQIDSNSGTTTLPADLELACLDTVLWLYDSRTDRRIGKDSKSKGDESVSYAQGLPQRIVEILDGGYTRNELPAFAPVGVENR